MGELVRGVFSILIEHPEGMAASEVLTQLERRVPPDAIREFVLSQLA